MDGEFPSKTKALVKELILKSEKIGENEGDRKLIKAFIETLYRLPVTTGTGLKTEFNQIKRATTPTVNVTCECIALRDYIIIDLLYPTSKRRGIISSRLNTRRTIKEFLYQMVYPKICEIICSTSLLSNGFVMNSLAPYFTA